MPKESRSPSWQLFSHGVELRVRCLSHWQFPVCSPRRKGRIFLFGLLLFTKLHKAFLHKAFLKSQTVTEEFPNEESWSMYLPVCNPARRPATERHRG